MESWKAALVWSLSPFLIRFFSGLRNYEILSEFYQKYFVDLRVLDNTCDPTTYPAPSIQNGRIVKYAVVSTLQCAKTVISRKDNATMESLSHQNGGEATKLLDIKVSSQLIFFIIW